MKNTKNKTGINATATLANINSQIQSLMEQRVGLAEPLKARYTEMTGELATLGNQIRELDATWRPSSLKPKAETRIREILEANGKPMAVESIIEAVGRVFSPWKTKTTLKKRSVGPKAVFAFADGKYSVKS